MNHRHTQIEAAFHASGIGADPLIGAIVQARQLQYFRNASFECFAAALRKVCRRSAGFHGHSIRHRRPDPECRCRCFV